jgi:hypothetical protein
VGTIFTIILIGMILYPAYWIYDNTTSENDSAGYKFFALVMALIIFGVAFFLFFPKLITG